MAVSSIKMDSLGSKAAYLSPVVDEANSSNAIFTTLTNPDGNGKNYRVAKWLVNGSLVVLSQGVVEALIVNGGYSGYGANNSSGGGGAGGNVRVISAMTLSVASHSITIGAGGIASAGSSIAGGASSIGSVNTSNGGASTHPGGLGGSTTTPGTGGRGIPSSIDGTIFVYSGGGGGGNGVAGNGGTSGGGQGEYTVNGNNQTAGTANTGGGGGGRWNNSYVQGANGGSGIVIVRWEI